MTAATNTTEQTMNVEIFCARVNGFPASLPNPAEMAVRTPAKMQTPTIEPIIRPAITEGSEDVILQSISGLC
jgi:hypothetical protein